MTDPYAWADYHAKYSNGDRSSIGGMSRYWLDRLDIHPKRTLALFRASRFAKRNRKKIPVFVHIPKTGGTYVNSCFSRDAFVSLSHMLLREKLTDQYIPVGLMGTKWKPSANHVLFTTVRNPLTFFRSYYHHVIGHGNYHNPLHYDYKIAQKGFDDLMRTIMGREDVWPSRKFLYPQLFDQSGKLIVSWINRIENLDEDMKLFAEMQGYSFLPGEKKRAAPVKDLSEYYSDALMEKVCEVYAREFDTFGYSIYGLKSTGKLYRDVSYTNVTYNYKKDELFFS